MKQKWQKGRIKAGAAAVDISPKDSQFLFGYPFVERYSTGIHDPLMSSALYLSNGNEQLLFIANDIIFVGKQSTALVRSRLAKKTGIPENNILISATHTHSGPITVNYLSNESDEVVPKADEAYVHFMEDKIVEAGVTAFEQVEDAMVGLSHADSTGVGTNRRDPNGPADHQVPVLLAVSKKSNEPIACMLVCSMHPTVLHEDSPLVSADFPGMARKYLHENVFGKALPVLHHTGPAGNQSPRHVTKANTYEEAERIGGILGKAVQRVLAEMPLLDEIELGSLVSTVDLPRRDFPSVDTADENRRKAKEKLERLRREDAPKQEVRTAECDWFGAEETYTLASAQESGKLEKYYQSCLPAEIQLMRVGPWNFVGWQGEIFVDYALQVKSNYANTYIISIANGELQGYIVTEEAVEEGGYEASNSLFSHRSGQIFVEETKKLVKEAQEMV